MEHDTGPQNDELKSLVVGAQQGDAIRARKLYDLLVDRIYAYIRGRTYTLEHATDMTQDVFIDFFAGLPRFTYRSPEELHAYAYRIAKRKLAKYYAAQAEHRTTESFDETTIAATDDHVAAVTRRDVESALSGLDTTAKEIVELHHYARYSFAEIGALLEMGESAVRVRHHRALKKLRESL